MVVIDAEKGFTKQDKTIMDDVITKGKGMAIIVNKWDLVKKETNTMKDFTEEMSLQFKSLSHYPVLFISAKTKQRISSILKLILTKNYVQKILIFPQTARQQCFL